MNEEMNLRARGGSLLLGDLENPNKMPFSGVLTYLGVPSDQAPGGSGGRKVMIPVEVGRTAIESLKGMPVNLAASMDDHDTSAVVGIIENAWLGEESEKGTPIHVNGHIFAKSFPEEARAIKASQKSLGFSYETAKTLLAAAEFAGEAVAVAKQLIFTGAAILFKKAAAYQSTSLAAKGEGGMEELARAILEKLAELKDYNDQKFDEQRQYIDTRLDEIVQYAERNEINETVERIAEASEEDAEESQVTASNKGADSMEQVKTEEVVEEKDVQAAVEVKEDAKDGVQASNVDSENEFVALIAKLVKSVDDLKDEVAEIKAAKAEASVVEEEKAEVVASAETQEPPRRSLSSLVAKFDVKADEGENIFAAIDRKNLSTQDSMAAKLSMLNK